jgi:tetratricopeptide (TPR) repeat protein
VLAVEVHQVDSHSADLVFDVSLSSRGLDPDPILAARSAHTRLRFCQLAAQLDANDDAVDKTLESLQDDEDAVVAAWALAARIQRSAKPNDLPFPEADEHRRQTWRAVSNELNLQVWEMVVLPNLSDDDARRALRKSHALWRLVETDEADYAGNAANTHGVALYRTGRFEEAITFLRKSMEFKEKNAVDLAYLSLALNCLGANEEALDMLAQAEEFEKRSTWPSQDEAAAALEEAAAALEEARAALHKNSTGDR